MIGLLALALLAAQDRPAGFGPADAARFARDSVRTAASESDMAEAAARLRVAMIVNPEATAASLPTGDRATIEAATGRIDGASAAGIAWFFRTAIERSSLVGPRGRTIWFSPLVDLALVVDWRRVDGIWHPIATRTVAGATVRAPALAQPWTSAGGASYQQAFADRATATLAGLPGDPAASGGVAPFARGITDAERGLAALRGDPAATAGASHAVTALASADPGKLSGAVAGPLASALAVLPLAVRRSLTVVTGYRRDAGWLAAIASPLRPELVFFVDLDRTGAVERISPVNLANHGGAAR